MKMYVAKTLVKPMRAGIINLVDDQNLDVLKAKHDLIEIQDAGPAETAGLMQIPNYMINLETGKMMLPIISSVAIEMYLSTLDD
jgi:hypothetical protein